MSVATESESMQLSLHHRAFLAPGAKKLRILGVVSAPTHARRLESQLALALVLDRSSSMTVPMMEAAKKAALTVVRMAREDDILMAVAFSDEVELVAGAARCIPLHLSDLRRQIKKVKAQGGTRMSRALKECAKRLKPFPRALKRILFLTDGRNTEPPHLLDQAVALCAKNGVEVHVWGFGTDWDPDELAHIARETGGRADVILSPAQAGAAFRGSFEAMKTTAASEIRLHLEFPQEVKVASLQMTYPQVLSMLRAEEEPGRLVAPLGSMRFGEKRSWLLELELPHRSVPFPLLQARLSYKGSDGTVLKCGEGLVDSVAEGDSPEEHPFITRYLKQIRLAEMAGQGRKLLSEGRDEEALPLLEEARKQAEAVGNRHLLGLLDDLLVQKRGLSSRETLGTRQTLALHVTRTVFHE